MPDRLLERVRRALASTIRIDAEIGRGGMGVVYLGWHVELARKVAVKVLHLSLTGSEEEDRFLREAQLMARFKHAHIIRVLDRPSPDQVDGLNLFVMEHVENESLAEQVLRKRLSPDEARRLGMQLLDALGEVHRHRVIHRDVKPANVVYDKVRRVWLLTDFGIAKVLDSPTLGAAGTAEGTREYMPPDQEEWRNPTAQRDLYSAAATIYEAYTSEQWNSNTSPTSAGWRGIPRRQAAALRKGSEPAAKDRWKTTEEFRKAFGPSIISPSMKVAIAVATAAVLALIVRTLWPRLPPPPPPPPVEMALVTFTTTEPTIVTKVEDLNADVKTAVNAVLDTDPVTVPACERVAALHCVSGQVGMLPHDSLVVAVTIATGAKHDRITMPPEPDPVALAGRVVIAVLSRTDHQAVIDECRLPGAPRPINSLRARSITSV